jgi:Ca2+-binding RTX toxin-like protein
MPKPDGGGANGGGGNGGGGGSSTYQGTSGDDLFALAAADLKGATILGGAGYDTLQLDTSGGFVFSNKSYRELSSIDAFDFSSHSGGTLDVRVHRSMLQQTDNAQLSVISGANGIDSLSAAETGQGTVIVDGTGTVQLADGTDNVVTIADGATVEVAGGSGNDTITANTTGSTLDGGSGNDTLIAGAGSDSIVFQSGYASDTVSQFDTAADIVELTGLSVTSFAELLALITDDATGAILDLGAGDQLQLLGVSKSSLTTNNFLVDGQVLPGNPPPPPDPQTIYIDPGTTAAALNAIIAGAADGSTIILRDGAHSFSESIIISRANITLKGESEAGTVITFDFPGGSEASGIQILAGQKTAIANATGAISQGDTSFTMPSGHGISAGDVLYIQQDNTQAYLDENGWTNVSWADADDRPFRESIVRVASVDGNTIHLEHAIAYDMDAGLAEVFSINMLGSVALSDFTVTYALGTPNPYDFAKTLPAYEGTAAIYLAGTDGATLSGITILDAASHGFDLRSSLELSADDLYVSGAHNKGGGGNGYAVQVYETFHSTFSNLELFETRHAFLLSSWHAESYNTAHITATNRDINFHGSPDHSNVITVDQSILDYDPSQNTGGGNGYWDIVSPGGSTHAATDIYGDNTVKFAHAEGYDRGETFYGTDTGAYLNGKEGQDTIFGGAGNDTVVGGGNKDALTGNAGGDTFVFYLDTNYDRVTDFNPAEGDQLVFAGNPAVTGFADLVLTQDGTDAHVRFGANSTVILEGHDIATLTDDGMIFDPSGDTWAPVYFGSDFVA